MFHKEEMSYNRYSFQTDAHYNSRAIKSIKGTHNVGLNANEARKMFWRYYSSMRAASSCFLVIMSNMKRICKGRSPPNPLLNNIRENVNHFNPISLIICRRLNQLVCFFNSKRWATQKNTDKGHSISKHILKTIGIMTFH